MTDVKPAFDPNQPFQVATDKPAFDPSKPFEAAPPAPAVSIGEDAAKSIAAGLASATAGTFGLAGDARSALSGATNWAGSKLGVSPDKVQAFKDAMTKAASLTGPTAMLANAPTSRQIIDNADPIVSPDYEPKTGLGGYLKTGAEFLPAMIGGPEGLATKALTRVVAPALASETAGQLTKGTAAEPYARVAGALAGGAGATAAMQKFQALAAAKAAQNAAPSGADLLKAGSNGFESVKASDAVLRPSSVQQMAKDIKTELLNDGRHPSSEGQAGVFNALDRLEAMGAAPGGVTPKDLEVIRKTLVGEKTNANPTAAGAARDATTSFMDKYSNLGQADILNGSNPFPTLKDAIGNYAAGKRSNTVTGKVDLAALNSGTAGSGANQDNNLRQAVKQLARPINNTNTPVAKRLGFNDAEVEAIKNAATGTTGGNAARYVGKGAPTGIVSAVGGLGVGHMVGGPVGAIAVPAVGYIAKRIGDMSTKKAVAAIDFLVRSRSPMAAQVASQIQPHIVQALNPKTQALLTAMVAADPILSQQMGSPVSQPYAQ